MADKPTAMDESEDEPREDNHLEAVALALRRGDLPALTQLVAVGTSLDTPGWSAVEEALKYSRVDLVPKLVALGARATNEDFADYLRRGRPTRADIEQLLAAGTPSSWTLIELSLTTDRLAHFTDLLLTPDVKLPTGPRPHLMNVWEYVAGRAIEANQPRILEALLRQDASLLARIPPWRWVDPIRRQPLTRERMRKSRAASCARQQACSDSHFR